MSTINQALPSTESKQTKHCAPTHITSKNTANICQDIIELVKAHELLFILSLKEIQVRYKQTAIGIVWVILQPLITTLVFTFIFGVIAKVDAPGVPYPVFVFSGLLLWQYISKVITLSAESLTANSAIITKVYFPRAILPIVPAVSTAVDFMIAFAVLILMMIGYGMKLPLELLYVPLILILTGLIAASIGMILAPLNALYRDVCLILPFILQIAMYLTPVVYPITFIPAKYKWFFDLNPFAALIDYNRHFILGTPLPSTISIVMLLGFSVTILISGLVVFRSFDKTIADRI